MRIGIITPGGDSSGMNACIRSIVREGILCGFELFGIYRGYQGLIEGEFKKLSARSVGGIIHLGGTLLKSTRCEKIKTNEGINEAYANLVKNKIDWLVIIGGDGSFRAGCKLSKLGMPVICIPASIDNDIYGVDETIGFDTAIDVSVDAIDKIRDTSMSFERIFMIEVMGKKRGFLAVAVALASGAEHVIIPEKKYDIEKLCRDLLDDRKKGKHSEVIIFAEGAGNVHETAQKIQNITGLSTRASALGYIQRGGHPSGRSRIIACLFGSHAISLVKRNLKNMIVVLKNNKADEISLEKAINRKKIMDETSYKMVRRLSL